MSKRQKTAGRMCGEWLSVPLVEHPTFWIFLKSGATDREVLVGNLDANHTEADVSGAFGEFGAVERVQLDPVPGQVGGALVTYATAASAASALAARAVRLAAEGSCPVRGLQRWAAECQGRMRQPEQLQREVEAFMAEFDARAAEEAREAAREVVDEDGFTLVTRARGRRGASDGDVHVRAAPTRAKRARGEAEEAFYGLQKLRARRQAVQQLRAKFEADKKRLRQMKERKSL